MNFVKNEILAMKTESTIVILGIIGNIMLERCQSKKTSLMSASFNGVLLIIVDIVTLLTCQREAGKTEKGMGRNKKIVEFHAWLPTTACAR